MTPSIRAQLLARARAVQGAHLGIHFHETNSLDEVAMLSAAMPWCRAAPKAGSASLLGLARATQGRELAVHFGFAVAPDTALHWAKVAHHVTRLDALDSRIKEYELWQTATDTCSPKA